MIDRKYIDAMRVKPGRRIKVADFDPGWAQSEELREAGKSAVRNRAEEILAESVAELAEAQQLLYADDRYAILIVLQAMDAAGKDGTIRHVMSGVNPQGVTVTSFKQPSSQELDHTFLWRYATAVPERGKIGIFNRSYYEDVLVVRVHPEWIERSKLPLDRHAGSFWEDRFEDINALERHLVRNGTVILKFFLNISKKEQRKRFLERLDNPKKHWKFSAADLAERAFWDQYMAAYSEAISATSTAHAPWYIVPADSKWISRAVVADIVATTIRELDLRYPEPTPQQRHELLEARRKLESE